MFYQGILRLLTLGLDMDHPSADQGHGGTRWAQGVFGLAEKAAFLGLEVSLL